ncbi:MAG: hypothetical protein OER77_08530 [Myxococcales bacterium]|nr:hypothetical protein [Myxococcales bacterium]
MFRPKETIPKLVVAMLALTGCGGDGNNGTGGSGGSGATGGTGGTGGSGGITENLANALNAWCMKLVPCYLEDYPDYTVEECIAYNIVFYGLDQDISAACDVAATSYFECGSMLMCDQLTMLNNDCDPEFNAAGDACN